MPARDEIRSIFHDHDKKRASAHEARQQKLLTDAGVRAELEKWNSQQRWTERLDQLRADARARFDQVASKPDQLRADFTKPPSGSAQEQLLFELRAQRMWSRIRPQLDALDGARLVERALRLATEVDGPDAIVLAQELTPYLVGRDEPADLVTTAFDAKIPGMEAAQEAMKQANAEYLQISSAADAVQQYIDGRQSREYAAYLAGVEE